MLADSQQYETKRVQLENWLQRMETRLERMSAVGHTADILEAQLREQKVNISFIRHEIPTVLVDCVVIGEQSTF